MDTILCVCSVYDQNQTGIVAASCGSDPMADYLASAEDVRQYAGRSALTFEDRIDLMLAQWIDACETIVRQHGDRPVA